MTLTTEQEDEARGLGYECPMTLEIMEDPVFAHDGEHAFEREAIEEYFAENEEVACPSCRQMITKDDVQPAIQLKQDIQQWLQALNPALESAPAKPELEASENPGVAPPPVAPSTPVTEEKAAPEVDAQQQKAIDNLNTLKQEILRAKRIAERTKKETVIDNFYQRVSSCLDTANNGEPRSGFEPCPQWLIDNKSEIDEWMTSPVLNQEQRDTLTALATPKGPEAEGPKAEGPKAGGIKNWNAFNNIKLISDNLGKSYKQERNKTGSFLKRFSKARSTRKSQLANLDKALKNYTSKPDSLNLIFLKATLLTIQDQIKAEKKKTPHKLGESGMLKLVEQIEKSIKELDKPPVQPKQKRSK